MSPSSWFSVLDSSTTQSLNTLLTQFSAVVQSVQDEVLSVSRNLTSFSTTLQHSSQSTLKYANNVLRIVEHQCDSVSQTHVSLTQNVSKLVHNVEQSTLQSVNECLYDVQKMSHKVIQCCDDLIVSQSAIVSKLLTVLESVHSAVRVFTMFMIVFGVVFAVGAVVMVAEKRYGVNMNERKWLIVVISVALGLISMLRHYTGVTDS